MVTNCPPLISLSRCMQSFRKLLGSRVMNHVDRYITYAVSRPRITAVAASSGSRVRLNQYIITSPGMESHRRSFVVHTTGFRMRTNFDDRHMHRGGHVHRARIIADKKMAAGQQFGGLTQGCLSRNVDDADANLCL